MKTVKVKQFMMTHKVCRKRVVKCSSVDFPVWLASKYYAWFRNDFVLELKVEEKVESDFWKIVRLS